MFDRRSFLRGAGLPAVALLLNPAGLASALSLALAPDERLPEDAARDEDFWSGIARAFPVDRSFVNLNHGGVSPAPATVLDAMGRHVAFSNNAPSYTMWRILRPRQELVRERLAQLCGVSREEIALTRNASESLQICQQGLPLTAGDEVLTTTQDYPRMLTTFRQMERRNGIVLKQFTLPTPAEDDEQIVRLFEQNISERTRLILMCHVVNLTGQVLPVKQVVAMARRYGIPVLVDGAHAFCHLDFRLADLDCDYYATSLHKWLHAPIGTGMLYVRRDKIAGLWPLMAAEETQDDDIRKFEEIGTHPAANALAVAEALNFHLELGSARKAARLVFLRNYWAERLLRHDRVRLHTSLKPGFACGIANVEIEGIAPGALNSWLWSTHRILTTPINHDEFQGIRVSPSVYTTLEELDRFVDAMEHLIQNGLPA